MLNNAGTPTKRSRLETHMNRETLFLSVILIVLCSVVAALSGVWLRAHQTDLELAQFFHKKDYLKTDDKDEKNKNYNYYGIAAQIVFNFLMAVIVFQIMIPISLYISMELVRLGQAYFMIRDAKLYDESSDSRFQCRALNINEDLGQVKCIFSDKTGTLTQNKMEFRCASIDGVDYSDIARQRPVGRD
jgi:phospholipid-transporting ATPase